MLVKYYEIDAAPVLLKNKVTGIICYAGQGYAHALVLRDSHLLS
jgi:ketol-acid reductoisomerase